MARVNPLINPPTELPKTAVLYVHNYFPYFYVLLSRNASELGCAISSLISICKRCDATVTAGSIEPPCLADKPCCRLAKSILDRLEMALQAHEKYQSPPVSDRSSAAAAIADVKYAIRKSVYGYHRNPELFLKIYCINPRDRSTVIKKRIILNVLAGGCYNSD